MTSPLDLSALRKLLHDRDHPSPRVGRKITHAEFRSDPAAAIQGDGVADYTQIVDEDGAVRMHIPHSYPVDDMDVGYAAAEALPALLDIAEAAAAYVAAVDEQRRCREAHDEAHRAWTVTNLRIGPPQPGDAEAHARMTAAGLCAVNADIAADAALERLRAAVRGGA